MNRYRSNTPLDDVPEPIGDVPAGPLDMRSDPALLAATYVRCSENFRVSPGGGAFPGRQVRAGIARQLGAGDTIQTILFAGIYRPDNDHDRLALVTASRLILFDHADKSVASYDFPVGETITPGEAVDFVQGGVAGGTIPTAWILRGLVKEPLKFDGASVTVDSDFEKGDFGLFYQDRMAVAGPGSRQEVSVSDYLDFTTWTLLNQFKILYGGDDYLVTLFPYQKDYVIIGTRKRFFVAYFAPGIGATGYSGGLVARDTFLRDVTREAGPIGRRAILEANGLIWFITDNGIYAFQPRLDLELTVLGEPLSAPIAPIMQRLSAGYAGGACIERLGERIYFAMPISDEPIKLTAASAALQPLLVLVFNLPGLLGGGYLATFTSETPHNLTSGELVEIKGASDIYYNGLFTVASVVNSTQFTISLALTDSEVLGTRATVQRIATRNNIIAVYNLALPGWESIDVLPSAVRADWLRVSDYGSRRPCLYEEGEQDEIGEDLDGLKLVFDLPALLSATNFASAPIAGRLVSRTLRWGAFPREVRACEVRLTLLPGDSGTITYTVKTPDRGTWTTTRTFDDSVADTSARKRCGKRGLEAEIEINSATGRPAVRSWAAEVTAAGRVAEE
jgi:hypothetical protein